MVTSEYDDWLAGIARRLDRWRSVPSDVLTNIVLRDGACVWSYASGDPPVLTGNDLTDRDLALWLCSHCPVRDACLELELRTAGAETVGVWGALNEDDRRALYPLWRQRREHADAEESEQDSSEGGEQP